MRRWTPLWLGFTIDAGRCQLFAVSFRFGDRGLKGPTGGSVREDAISERGIRYHIDVQQAESPTRVLHRRGSIIGGHSLSSTFALLSLTPESEGWESRIFYGEIAANLPGREAVVSPIEGS